MKFARGLTVLAAGALLALGSLSISGCAEEAAETSTEAQAITKEKMQPTEDAIRQNMMKKGMPSSTPAPAPAPAPETK